MKRFIFILVLLCALCSYSEGQITYRGCIGVLGAQNFTLSLSGTTNDGGVIRNTYESLPGDFTQSCPAGVCELRIIWDVTQDRWEIQLDNDGPLNAPDYTTAELYFNLSASAPNPPSLSLGTWNNAGFCADPVAILTGDVQSSVGLPVEMVYFKAVQNANKTTLLWQTATEQNNEKFEVEASTDGLAFQKIGEVAGGGTANEPQNYAFLVDVPTRGMAYYRLKQIDFDGQFVHSEVVSVNTSGGNEAVGAFYPNPSKSGVVQLIYHAQEAAKISVSVFDVSGKRLRQQRQVLSPGNNTLGFDFSTLPKGLYVVKLGDEESSVQRKLVID
ncbi:T9SS type A sorting domain-containing protein [Neolewinella lacunae]|uniref:T9SS type A sorting domain-containing protein n=1 Tax=Neolewinella lacunae TaxID=1517758 RepID=A0A923T746_9BACT|nr:T9SS type A sorting domain-containing protein [Neolewinella lacunae]MBC6994105.1 T9SS type A sorting domain-containing protein [Neolewinella lacunae]MDN3636746.1 T9SS type A sorting domain-containing protein [Neolewinella lacunae]